MNQEDLSHIENMFSGEGGGEPQQSQDPETQKIIEQRKEKFRQMGVEPTFEDPNELYEAQAQSTHAHAAGTEKMSKIQQIKQGKLKGRVRELNKAKSPNEGQSDMEEMNRGVQQRLEQNRKRAQQQNGGQQKSENTPELKSFDQGKGGADSDYLSSLESMWTTDGGGGNPATASLDEGSKAYLNKMKGGGGESDGQLISDDYFQPATDWEQTYRQKMGKTNDGMPMQQPQTPPQQQPPQQPSPQQFNEEASQDPNLQPPGLGPTQINQMIEERASKIVEKKMNEFMEYFNNQQQKNEKKGNELTYKRVRDKNGNLLKNVIQINGKFYKLQEIRKKK